ncbi:hypothetical protein [Mucilaginibacter sp.]|uniref:hypothetical protein n=1 Tax=Mucilaginibacter sp. TaxID=1882438 RepID=UPI003263B8B9
MERIVLEVDDAAGKFYRTFTDEDKIRFQESISIMLKKSINDLNFDTYMLKLDKLSDQAVKNGLTQEKLDELLNTND